MGGPGNRIICARDQLCISALQCLVVNETFGPDNCCVGSLWLHMTVRHLAPVRSVVRRQSRTTPPKHNLAASKATRAKVGATPCDILAAGRVWGRAPAGTNHTTDIYEFLTPSIPIRLSSMSLSLNICHLYLALYFLEELPALLFLPPFHFHMIWWRARGSFIGVEYEANVNWRGWTSILPL
jgi:hypothetical protein